MNYDAIDIADLKELFKDGNRSAGSNFSTLIDYFGSNAVKDNGDGTIEVNGKSVDITNIADFTPSDYAILSVDANFTGGLQSNGVDVATETDVSNLDTDISNLDSKVVHLSGTETVTGDKNFDTVPTVNNNPLLLASSLPSDLARTGQDTNFTGKLQKSGVDVATVDDVSAKQDKLNYTPANDENVIHRSPDTGRATDTTDFPYKGLTVDGYPVIPFVLVPDRKTALAKTAQYPNYAFMYGKELN